MECMGAPVPWKTTRPARRSNPSKAVEAQVPNAPQIKDDAVWDFLEAGNI
jgi:hypothetical protein